MGARLALSIAVASLMIAIPGASADQEDLDTLAAECSAPPCGYITPILDMEFEGKQPCGGIQLIYSEGPPQDCDPIMENGGSHAYDGVVRWYWEMSEDGTYAKEPGKDIEISFSSTGTNPKWIDVEVTGPNMEDGRFVIDDAALVHPDNIRTDEDNKVWFWYEEEITATFTRTGDPGTADLQRIESREGVIPFFVKAKSTESSQRFRESFGVEEFRFLTCNDVGIANAVEACPDLDESGEPLTASDEEAPGLPLVVGLGAIATVAWFRRRL